MNIGAFDNLCLQLLPVFDLDPKIGTLGVRTVNTFSGTEQQAVFAVVAVKTAEGNVAVFALGSNRTGVIKCQRISQLRTLFSKRKRAGAAVLKQLSVVVGRMATVQSAKNTGCSSIPAA